MPDYSPDATPRYIAKYRVAGLNHSLQIRGYRGESAIAVVDRGAGACFDIFNPIAAALCDDFIWLAAFYIPEDTNVSVGATLPADVTGLVGIEEFSSADKISHLSFAGKGATGAKVSLKVYGTGKTLDDETPGVFTDFLLTSGESGIVSSIVAALNARDVAAIDNSVSSWYPRATVKINDAWLRRLRAGSI
jgi:hypothetical protein